MFDEYLLYELCPPGIINHDIEDTSAINNITSLPKVSKTMEICGVVVYYLHIIKLISRS